LTDALMSALAMFSLKDPSLLMFDGRRDDENMRNLFGIACVPSDTRMREILDLVEPRQLRPSFNDVFRQLQRGKALEPFVFYQGCYLLSLDGTGYFSSSSIHCDSCLEKVNKQTGEITYQHQVLAAWDADGVTTMEWQEGKVSCEIDFINDVPLNEANPDVRVNWLQYAEYGPDGQERRWTWVTDLEISRKNARWLVRGGRCRWKIENETFNTLKNQGYHFEHNYGHGENNLSVVFAMLMMLAFLVDQVQQLCCPLFRAAWKRMGSKRALWESLRSHFRHFVFRSMRHLYQVMFYHADKKLPAPVVNTG
jgi:hypothetical protein